MSTRRLKAGFTLIELLLVLAIVAILAAIAIPSYLGAKDYAKYVGEARTQAQTLRMALESYKADNGAYPPAATYTWRINGGGSPLIYTGPTNPVPGFQMAVNGSGSLQLDLDVFGPNLLTYRVRARDPRRNRNYFQMDQNGVESQY